MSLPGDPTGIEIVPGSMGSHLRCGGQTGTLKIKLPEEGKDASIEGTHDAFWICDTCKKEIPCRVKIDLQRHRGN